MRVAIIKTEEEYQKALNCLEGLLALHFFMLDKYEKDEFVGYYRVHRNEWKKI